MGPQPLFTPVPWDGTSPLPWSTELLKQAFKPSVTGPNNSDYGGGTSKRKVHQAIPQSQTRQAASLETEKGNREKTGVKHHASNTCENCSLLLGNLLQLLETGIGLLRKNPRLPSSVIVRGYLWSWAKLRTVLILSSTSVSSGRFSSASVAICHKSCQ